MSDTPTTPAGSTATTRIGKPAAAIPPATDPLLVDAYAGDGPKDWTTLAAAGLPWAGAWIKATQGVTYNGGTWFRTNWTAVRLAGERAGRYGESWFRGCYHYLNAGLDGDAQATYYLKTVEAAGGWAKGDLWPIVDVERADQTVTLSRSRVIDCVSIFTDRIRKELGRSTMLYGGSWLAELGITSHMGCEWLAVARYTPTLPRMVYERIGWPLEKLVLWQYCGDGFGQLARYPREAPGCGKVDISAVVLAGGLTALRSHLWAEAPASSPAK